MKKVLDGAKVTEKVAAKVAEREEAMKAVILVRPLHDHCRYPPCSEW